MALLTNPLSGLAAQWAGADGVALRKPDGLPVSLRRGIRTVLFGDSMTDWYHSGGPNPSAVSYAAATGVLTITYGSAHEFPTGCGMRVWHYGYTALRDQVYVPLTVTSSTTATVQLAPNLSGVPDGALAAGTFAVSDNCRAAASFVNWLQMFGGWPLRIVRNAAQAGDPVAGNVRRLARDIAAYSPDIVIGQSPGINDLRSGDNRSESQIIADLTTLYDGILATGALLVVGTITPVSATEADRAYRGNMMTVLRVNDWIRSYASQHPGMTVLDHYRHFVDPANANGLALTTRVRNDGIHPATKSAILLAKQALAALNLPAGAASSLPQSVMDCHANSRLTISSAVAAAGVVTVTSTSHKYKPGDEFRALGGTPAEANGWFTVATAPNGNTFTYAAPGIADGAITGLQISRSRNLFINPLLSTATGGVLSPGAGNTITGTAAGNLSVGVNSGTGLTGVASVAPAINVAQGALGYALPLVGNEQVLDVSAAAAGNIPAITTYGSTAYQTQMLDGRSYVIEGVLRLGSTDWAATWLSNLYCKASVNTSVGWLSSIPTIGQDTTETQAIAEDMRLHVRTGVIRIPAGATISSSDMTFRITVGAAFSSGPVLTMGLSQINVLDVTGDEASWL